MPNAFGRMTGSEVDASHIFPQGVLVAVTLVGSGAGDGGAKGGPGYEARLPL